LPLHLRADCDLGNESGCSATQVQRLLVERTSFRSRRYGTAKQWG
jgi:hypothetical protein